MGLKVVLDQLFFLATPFLAAVFFVAAFFLVDAFLAVFVADFFLVAFLLGPLAARSASNASAASNVNSSGFSVRGNDALVTPSVT